MNTFVSPFKAHICWFASADDARCLRFARELYEFLHRPIADDFVLRPGVEMPVEVGRDLGKLLAALEAGTEPAVGTRLVIALLDSGAFDDAAARKVIANAAKRWTEARRDEVFLPVLLDRRWAGELQRGPVEMLAGLAVPDDCAEWQLPADVGVVAGRALLRRLYDKDPPRPRVFISHAKADGAKLAKDLAAFLRADTRVDAWFDATDIERGEELGRQLVAATSDGIVLVVRTDRYSESPWCAMELLAAKRARVPIVTLLAGTEGEPSTSPYGGNHRTMVWRPGRELEVVARCVQAWMHAHYFRQYAAAALALAGLPADSEILTRRPELLDITDSGATRRLIVHPDPPLTDNEATVLRTARPSVRLATPTTLFGRVLLAKDPEPPLSGMTIAFSLSTAEELPELADAIETGTGLTQLHLMDVLNSIVLTTVHSGARISYGGDFRRAGFSQLLSDLLRSRRRLGNSASTQLLSFLRPYKQDAAATEAKRDIEYSPVPVPMPEGVPADADKETQANAWHLAMREVMAVESDARIILGGKTKPASDDEAKPASEPSAAQEKQPDGYHGAWPGVLEETWRMLKHGRGVFVIGGFSGAAGLIANMLRTGTIPEAFRRTTWPVLQPRLAKLDAARTAMTGKASDDVLLARPGGGFYDIEDLARSVLDSWQAFVAQDTGGGEEPRWTNGLTRVENERLFVSTDRTEITYLVFEGLRRLARAADPTLKLAAYHGDIALVPEVNGYAVTITPGVPPVGASVALDKRMGGKLATIAKAPLEPVTVVATGGDLVGSLVMVVRLDLPPAGKHVTAAEVTALAERVARTADKLGVSSIACPAFASTMGLDLAESVKAMVAGFDNANARALRTLVFCETDAARYEKLRDALGNEAIELRSGPQAERPDYGAVIHIEAAPNAGGWNVRSTLFATDGKHAVVPRAEVQVDGATWDRLRRRSNRYADTLELGHTLWSALLSPEIRERLRVHRDRRLVVLTEENGAGLPWEFITDDQRVPLACRQGVVRRIALTGDAIEPEPPGRSGALLRVLLIVNPLEDLPNTVSEADHITRVLRGRPDVEVVRLEAAEATREAVIRELASGNYDVLHYAGHAFFDARDRTRSGLRLAGNQVLTAADLPQLRPPRLVYLSACESVRVRGDTEPTDSVNTQSLAEALLRRGVSALIGTFFAVADNPAKEFAAAAYTQIAAGQSLGTAVLVARKLLVEQQAADWGNFMLYGDDQLII